MKPEAERLIESAKVVHLQPDDVVVFLWEENLSEAAAVEIMDMLDEAFGDRKVVMAHREFDLAFTRLEDLP